MNTFRMFLLISMMLAAQCVQAEVWPTTRSWIDQRSGNQNGELTELEYSQWIRKNASADFFSNPLKPLKAMIQVDCARATFAMRLVFAKEMGLPFVVIGNSGKVYDSRAESSSFIEFAAKVIGDVSTHGMTQNSFPVSLDKNTFSPGLVYLFQVPDDRGVAVRHAYLLKAITDGGVPHFIWANVPASTRVLAERLQFPYHMTLKASLNNAWGFRRFFQPQDYEKMKEIRSNLETRNKYSPLTTMEGRLAEMKLWDLSSGIRSRGYSENSQNALSEQVVNMYLNHPRAKKTNLKIKNDFAYDAENIRDEDVSVIAIYQNELARKLRKVAEALPQTLQREFMNTCFYIRERIGYVNESNIYFFKTSSPIVARDGKFLRMPNPEEVFFYSSPARDQDMRTFFKGVKNWYSQNREEILKKTPRWAIYFEYLYMENPKFPANFNLEQAEQMVESTQLTDSNEENCSFAVDFDDKKGLRKISAREVIRRFLVPGLISSQPWAPMDRRWGARSVSVEQLHKENNIQVNTVVKTIQQKPLFD